MTIYAELLKLGYTDEQIKDAVVPHLGTQTFGLSYTETPDGWPIIGVKYQCDFRSEEETGVGKMARTFAGATDQSQYYLATKDGGYAFKTDMYIYDVDWEIQSGREYWSKNLGYAQGAQTLKTYRMTVKEMKAWAKDNRFSLKGKTKREDIEPMVRAFSIKNAVKMTPNQWPGWFHNGTVLYLKAEGIVGEVLDLLHVAGQEDSLDVLGASQVFGSGFGFYDKRDIGPKLQAEIGTSNKAYEDAMEALKPVQEDLEAKGHRFYFLGKPSNQSDGVTRYWMNGMATDLTYGKQSFGWYSLEDLKNETFVEDARCKKLQNDLVFHKGSYRSDHIYTKDGGYDYAAMAKRDGLPDDRAYHLKDI